MSKTRPFARLSARLLGVSTVGVILTQCITPAPPPAKKLWVDPASAGKILGHGVLTIAYGSQLRVESEYAIQPQYTKVFKDHFTKEVPVYSNFDSAIIAPGVPSVSLEPRLLQLGEDDVMELLLPQDGGTARFGDWMSRYVLFVGQVTIMDRQLNMASPHDKAAEVEQSMPYAIWDNKGGRIVTYGIARADGPICAPSRVVFCNPDHPRDEDLRPMMSGLASAVFQDTPFVRSRRRLKPPAQRHRTLRPVQKPTLVVTSSPTATSTAAEPASVDP